MIGPEVLRALRKIDWDFVTPRSGYVAPLHWYPATFVPALSDALIEALSPTGGVVFDPYSGIGTTGWSAIRMGRSCQLADLNPVAVLAGYSSTSMLTMSRRFPGTPDKAVSMLAALVGETDDLLRGVPSAGPLGFDLDKAVAGIAAPHPRDALESCVAGPPVWSALSPWFEERTLAELQRAYANVRAADSAYVQVMGLCMLSAVLRSLSSQHASWGHIADNVRPKSYTGKSIGAAATRWLRNALKFISKPRIAQAAAAPAVELAVYRKDWSQACESEAVLADLLLTSPPYADAIDYLLSQRLSLYLLGYEDAEISALVTSEIGARRKRNSKRSRETWAGELVGAIQQQVTWVKPSGAICLVLPHKDSGRNGGKEMVRVTLKGLGWDLVFEKNRSIHQSHTRQSWTSIKRETILVFARAD